VLSAVGSSEISGASRWLDAFADAGPEPRATNPTTSAVAPAAAKTTHASLRIGSLLLSVE
jgi:hypothetical protein